jgi:hypothetical protein
MMVWQPDAPELLEATFHLEGGLNWTIRTDDGATWLLESEAARELESLGPTEGQSVRVMFNGMGEPAYEVDLPWSPSHRMIEIGAASPARSFLERPHSRHTVPRR